MSGDMDDMDDIEIVAKNIRRARKIRKISKKDLAARLGLSEKKLSMLESGKEYQDDDLIEKIADVLNFRMDFFFQLPDKEFEEKILLRNSRIGARDKESIIELAKYKAAGAASLVIVLGLKPFAGVERRETINKSDAKLLGKQLALTWIDHKKTLSEILEENGIFIITLPGTSGLFRGLFIQKRGIPVIVMYEHNRSPRELIKDMAHEVGHAVFLKQNLEVEQEEELCDSFSDGFSEEVIRGKVEIGAFDFVQRMSIKAWKSGEISGSRAAEILEMRLFDFMEKYQYENHH